MPLTKTYHTNPIRSYHRHSRRRGRCWCRWRCQRGEGLPIRPDVCQSRNATTAWYRDGAADGFCVGKTRSRHDCVFIFSWRIQANIDIFEKRPCYIRSRLGHVGGSKRYNQWQLDKYARWHDETLLQECYFWYKRTVLLQHCIELDEKKQWSHRVQY